MNQPGRSNAGKLGAVAVIAIVTAGALAWALASNDAEPAPSTAGDAKAPRGGILLDYSLYYIDKNGTEWLTETSHFEIAQEANRTQGFRLLGEGDYAPWFVEWKNLSRPRLVMDFILRGLDPALLEGGARHDLRLTDPIAPQEELVEGEVKRRWGPFPTTYSVTREAFVVSMKQEPEVGRIYPTRDFFDVRVERITPLGVELRVNVTESQVVVARHVAATYLLDFTDDGSSFHMVLTPLARNMRFTLDEDNRVLGLTKGVYLWTGITKTSVSYKMHPTVSPELAGRDYRLDFHVLEASSRDGFPNAGVNTRNHHE